MSCNKRHPDTPTKIAVETHLYEQDGTKTMFVYFPADVDPFWLLLSSLVLLLSVGTVQPENTFLCILKVTSQV